MNTARERRRQHGRSGSIPISRTVGLVHRFQSFARISAFQRGGPHACDSIPARITASEVVAYSPPISGAVPLRTALANSSSSSAIVSLFANATLTGFSRLRLRHPQALKHVVVSRGFLPVDVHQIVFRKPRHKLALSVDSAPFSCSSTQARHVRVVARQHQPRELRRSLP